jgi:hypothetical protein
MNQRCSVPGHHHADDHLLPVGTVVLRIEVLPQAACGAFPLEVDRGRVEEEQVGCRREQVPSCLRGKVRTLKNVPSLYDSSY